MSKDRLFKSKKEILKINGVIFFPWFCRNNDRGNWSCLALSFPTLSAFLDALVDIFGGITHESILDSNTVNLIILNYFSVPASRLKRR